MKMYRFLSRNCCDRTALTYSRREKPRSWGNTDAAQLRYAVEHQRAVLTHNRVDFEQLHAVALETQWFHAGILVANRRASDFELARRIMTLLDRFTADEVDNQLPYLEISPYAQHRIRSHRPTAWSADSRSPTGRSRITKGIRPHISPSPVTVTVEARPLLTTGGIPAPSAPLEQLRV